MSFRELTGGNGCSILSATPGPDLAAAGYDETEYAVDGTVGGVTAAGVVAPAEFTTRVLVRRPVAQERFNGVLVVEWLNVSSGSDAAPEYTYLAEELVRGGYAWAGVSAQYTGIEGGEGSVGLADAGAQGLAGKDPERYAGLRHPGDAYCFDIFAAVGRALSPDADDPAHPLAGLSVHHTLAVGESQSAMALTTYTTRFAAEHRVFDAYLIHSRAAAGLPLGEPDSGIDVGAAFLGEPTPLRTDLDVPVFTVQTETDVLTNFRFYRARQPDTDRIRTWEIAGTSHADLHQIGPYESMLGCPQPVNRGQQRFVLRAALRHLHTWVSEGTPPPTAEPLLLDHTNPEEPQLVTDELGNARGGVRTPCVEAATQVLSGVVPDPVSRICLLFGSTTPIPSDLLAARYGTRENYQHLYDKAADASIADGFTLPDDRAELRADANPDLIP